MIIIISFDVIIITLQLVQFVQYVQFCTSFIVQISSSDIFLPCLFWMMTLSSYWDFMFVPCKHMLGGPFTHWHHPPSSVIHPDYIQERGETDIQSPTGAVGGSRAKDIPRMQRSLFRNICCAMRQCTTTTVLAKAHVRRRSLQTSGHTNLYLCGIKKTRNWKIIKMTPNYKLSSSYRGFFGVCYFYKRAVILLLLLIPFVPKIVSFCLPCINFRHLTNIH